jgi:putative spermidine/putrescine transport system ATP-binding protein
MTQALPIAIRGVTKTYGKVFALDHVDLDVRSGEFLTLLGPSGSGKTTLLMVLAGFTRPDHGSILFGDREIIRMPPHKRDLGMVFQNYALFPHMTVAANVGFPLRLRKVGKAEIAARVERALETVQLAGYGDRGIDQLSGGQRQRVALARAIVFEPRILLMDEPLSALDKKLREYMQIELRRLHDKLGMTTVYVTHDQREALTMSDRIAVMSEGRILQLGSPAEIYNHPAERFVADFIGDTNFLEAEVTSLNGRAARVRLPGGAVRNASLPEGLTPAPGERVTIVIRPEHASLAPGSNAAGDLEGTVENAVFFGTDTHIHLRLAGDTPFTLRRQNTGTATAPPEPGQTVHIQVAEGGIQVLRA